MDKPTLADYAQLISTRFCKFQQTDVVELKHQHLYTYQDKPLILFFMLSSFGALPDSRRSGAG